MSGSNFTDLKALKMTSSRVKNKAKVLPGLLIHTYFKVFAVLLLEVICCIPHVSEGAMTSAGGADMCPKRIIHLFS